MRVIGDGVGGCTIVAPPMHPPPRPGRPAIACDVAVGILSVSDLARESDVRDIHLPRRNMSRHLLAFATR
eukprot:8178626-Pyramimonas_sp.AAC.1